MYNNIVKAIVPTEQYDDLQYIFMTTIKEESIYLGVDIVLARCDTMSYSVDNLNSITNSIYKEIELFMEKEDMGGYKPEIIIFKTEKRIKDEKRKVISFRCAINNDGLNKGQGYKLRGFLQQDVLSNL